MLKNKFTFFFQQKRTRDTTNKSYFLRTKQMAQQVAEETGVHLWTEKYRPKKVHQMVGDNGVRGSLATEIIDNIAHVLFCGPPGSGKTTTAHAVARECFPFRKDYEQRVFELNGTKDRGVGVVRDTLPQFLRQMCPRNAQTLRPNSTETLPPIRIVILDEADGMTHEAQAVLRQMTETYGENGVRFFILCNYPSNIIVPILSRCYKVYFQAPPADQVAKRLWAIATHENTFEGTKCGKMVCDHIAMRAAGDMRKAIATLQSVHDKCIAEKEFIVANQKNTLHSKKAVAKKEFLDKDKLCRYVDRIVGAVPDAIIDKLVDELLCVPALNKIPNHRAWSEAAQILVIDQAHSVGRCMEQIAEKLLTITYQKSDTKSAVLDLVVAQYIERLALLDNQLHDHLADPKLIMLSLYHAKIV